MNRKTKSVYVCSSCGESYPKWMGKCDNCGSWDTITEFREPAGVSRSVKSYNTSPPEVVALDSHKGGGAERIPCQFPEVDRVLGGGLVRGGVALLGGDPGIGKSTLLPSSWPTGRREGKRRSIYRAKNQQNRWPCGPRAWA